MKRFNNLSIRSKMTLVIMLASCIALLAACAVLLVYESISDRNARAQQLEILAEMTGRNCAVFISIDNREGAEEVLANLTLDSNIESLCIYSKEGQIWTKFPKPLADSEFREKPDAEKASHRFNAAGLHVFAPIRGS